MDQYSEIEAKFDANDLNVAQIQAFVDELPFDGATYRCYNYKQATGTDTFFKVGEGVFRYRRDEVTKNRDYYDGPPTEPYDHPRSILTCLTVKERKSAKNLLNRKEVDLWVGDKIEPEDMRAFVGLLGGSEQFSIKKTYWVWMLEKNDIHICLAMYDVERPDGSDKRRFLEVEVEKNSACTQEEGMAVLRTWISMVQENFGLQGPVNTSLLELYGKGK